MLKPGDQVICVNASIGPRNLAIGFKWSGLTEGEVYTITELLPQNNARAKSEYLVRVEPDGVPGPRPLQQFWGHGCRRFRKLDPILLPTVNLHQKEPA